MSKTAFLPVLISALALASCNGRSNESAEEPFETAYTAYDDLISYIVQGYQCHWADGMTPENYGLSLEYLKESSHAGFCKTDLDGDGIIDLVLGEQFPEGPTAVYDLLTIDRETLDVKHLEPQANCRRLPMDYFASYAADRSELWKQQFAPIEERVEDLLGRLTPEEKIGLLIASAGPIDRLGIPKYYHGNEALHGIIRPGRFTVFPQAIAMASMWDPDLVWQIANAASDEARARWNELGNGEFQIQQFTDLLTFWSPTVNMARDPRWGRTPETYGEDPYLTGVLGTAFVRGLQGDDPRYLKVVSTPKHFACNNEEHNRFECNAVISEKQLREYYLPAYEMCVKEGDCESIMASYTSINGMPSSCNHWLLTEVLRDDWGFDGYVVSDCGGVEFIRDGHKYAADYEEAAMLAIKAGLDLECGDCVYVEPLRNAYEKGMVSDEDLNRAARRVLTARMKLGLFDNNIYNPYTRIDPLTVGCQKHQDIALEAARKSIVLLKNEDSFLPLDESRIKSVAIVGNNAAKCELGDYSGIPSVEPVSVYKAVSERLAGKVQVNYAPWRAEGDETDLIGEEYFEDGINAEYFDDMEYGHLWSTRKEPYILYEPANRPPDPEVPDSFMSARWLGTLVPDVTGEYTLRMESIGYGVLYIDGRKIFEGGDRVAKIHLNAGQKYKLVAEHDHVRDVSPLLALKWAKPSVEVEVDNGVKKHMREAVEAAEKSDVVIAVMGINRHYEQEGRDRKYLSLPPEQIEFLQAIHKANSNIVLVLVAGSSMTINWENENIPAIVDAWYGGEFGGKAIEEVLFGDYNPAGRLPLTFYKSMEQLPAFNNYDLTLGRTYKYFRDEPLYTFGHGLSYTSFRYGGLRVKEHGDSLDVSFTLKNTGSRDGDEVAQVYVRLKDYETENGVAPIKELKGFKRVALKAGEKQRVKISIPYSQLRYWSVSDHAFRTTGEIPEILVGSSSSDIRLTAK
ncbi:MAG: glycoside hydrolase family 3 C-terminal domain-containing protein [Bacteroidales bacterium]|nr:glycoside hydrolase family 3 C-terminal domain-containing protein [Bacteroidales bacterium]